MILGGDPGRAGSGIEKSAKAMSVVATRSRLSPQSTATTSSVTGSVTPRSVRSPVAVVAFVAGSVGSSAGAVSVKVDVGNVTVP